MSKPFNEFTTPAHQAPKDFNKLGLEQDLKPFQRDWSDNVSGWTEMAITGNPWSNINDAPRSDYFNPLKEGDGEGQPVVISWTPFPNRLIKFLTDQGAANNPQLERPLSKTEVMALADSGEIEVNGKVLKLYDPEGKGTLLKIPATLCPEVDWQGKYSDFSPSGPRGWLDEYCEWSITYDKAGNMRSVMFTCENPAYYLTMWRINPEAVLGLYRDYVDPAVQLEDLYLRYPVDQPTGKKGEVVMDPTTGRPAYDVTNKWNRGTSRVPGQYGGALHLTSGPNTLSAEVYLAAAATIQRPDRSSMNAQTLICCSKYGQNFRNSDPHIGFAANGAAATHKITLTDPVGLYIQQPTNLAQWKGPGGQDVSDYWQVTRGTAGTGPGGSDQILHAVFEIPESAGFSINDVTINGQKIGHVGDIAETMNIALSATPKKPEGPLQPIMDCVAPCREDRQPWPVQMLPQELFYGNSPTDLPALLAPGSKHRFVLIVQGADKHTTTSDARVAFSDPGIGVRVHAFLPNASAIPGQTDGGGTQGFVLDVHVGPSVKPGPVGVRVLNPDEPDNPSEKYHPWAQGLAVVPAGE